MKMIVVIMFLVLTGCTSKISSNDPINQLKVEQSKIENITFDATKKASQTAAEVFDIGTVSVNGTITKTFTLSNLTTTNITLNFTDLQTQLSTNDRFSINLATATPCGTSLKLNKTCSFNISLKYNATGVQDYTQPILTNIIDLVSQGGNTEFGKVMFTGSKASDLTTTTALAGLVKLNTLSDSFIVPQGGNQTKRFYIGNIGAGNLKAPAIVAPAGGTISTNACVSGAAIKPNGTCFFDINYAYVDGASANTQIGFISTDPLVDMTNLKIQLAVTMQAAVVPTVSANFTQVGSITDLTSASQTTRVYITNNGSATENPLLATIPTPYVIASTSCTTTLKVGKSCFFDLKIDPTLTTNMDAVSSPITLGSSSNNVKSGNSSSSTTTCKSGFSFFSNKCVTSNVAQSCTMDHGVGSQSSTNGGVSFSACAPVSCDSNYASSSNTCAPVACTVQNSNIGQAASVSGDLVSGCVAQSCVSGFTLVANNCASNSVIAPLAGQIKKIINGSSIITFDNRLIYIMQNNGNSMSMLNPQDTNLSYTQFITYYGQLFPQNNINKKTIADSYQKCSLENGALSCTNGMGRPTGIALGFESDIVDFMFLSQGRYVCGLTVNGLVKCSYLFGSNFVANEVVGLSNVKSLPIVKNQIYGGQLCIITNDSHVKCASPDTSNNIVADKNISNAKEIYTTDAISCAVLNDGTAKCWGSNSHGECGTGTATPQSILPTVLLGVSNIKELNLGGWNSSFALLADGTVMSWGWNIYNGLGRILHNSESYSATPSLIAGLSNVKELDNSDYRHACAVLNDGTAKCWGNNSYGDLGNVSFQNSITPVSINGYYTNISGEHRSLIDDAIVNLPSTFGIAYNQNPSFPQETINNTNSTLIDVTIDLTKLSIISSGSNDIGDTKKLIVYNGYGYPNNNLIEGTTIIEIPLSNNQTSVTFQVPNNGLSLMYRFLTTNNENKTVASDPYSFYGEATLPSPIISSINLDSSLVINLQDQNLQQFSNTWFDVQFFNPDNIIDGYITSINGFLSPDGQSLIINGTDLSTLNLGNGQNYVVAISMCSQSTCYPIGSYSPTFTYVAPAVFPGTVSFNPNPLSVTAVLATNYKWSVSPANPLVILDFSAGDSSFITQLADINVNSSLNINYIDNNGNTTSLPFDSTQIDSSNWLSAGSFVIEDSNCSINNIFNPSLNQHKIFQLCGNSVSGFTMAEINWNSQTQGDGSTPADIGNAFDEWYLPANVIYPDDSKKTFFVSMNDYKLYSIAQDVNTIGSSGLSIIDEGVICTSATDLSTSPAMEVSGGGGGLACIMQDGSKFEFPWTNKSIYYTTIPYPFSNYPDSIFTNYQQDWL